MGIFDFYGSRISIREFGITIRLPMPFCSMYGLRRNTGRGMFRAARNLPLQSIDQAAGVIKDKSTPLFVYCYSGSRSSQAVSRLMKMGYQNVKNIGGMASYSGKVEL